MYDPPNKINWHYTHLFDESYTEAYGEGYEAAIDGLSEDKCPYKKNGHELDVSYQYEYELNYWWNHGYNDFKYGLNQEEERRRHE